MRIFVALLSLIVLASFASAELLTTANPIGQGKWAALGAGVQDANVANNSSYSALSLGGYGGYGVTDKLDVFVQAGQLTVNGLPAGLSSALTAYGLALKYAVLEEGKNLPVSVSAGAGYKSISYKRSALLGGDSTGSQIGAAIGVSKIMAPFVPYAGLAYRNTNGGLAGGAADSTQIDVTIGSAIAWSTQGAVFVEYTLQLITPNSASGTANHSSGQIGLGVGYNI